MRMALISSAPYFSAAEAFTASTASLNISERVAASTNDRRLLANEKPCS